MNTASFQYFTVIILFGFGAIYVIHGDLSNFIEVKRYDCSFNYDYFLNSSFCAFGFTANSSRLIRVHMNLHRSLPNIMFHFKYWRKSLLVAQAYQPFLIDLREDYCAYQRGRGGILLKLVMTKLFQLAPKFNTTCPMPADNYSVELVSSQMIHTIFPSMFPTGFYKVQIRMYSKKTNEFYMNQVFYYSCTAKGASDID